MSTGGLAKDAPASCLTPNNIDIVVGNNDQRIIIIYRQQAPVGKEKQQSEKER